MELDIKETLNWRKGRNCIEDIKKRKKMAPKVGLEPTTNRLTAGCSTTELLRNAIIELQFCCAIP